MTVCSVCFGGGKTRIKRVKRGSILLAFCHAEEEVEKTARNALVTNMPGVSSEVDPTSDYEVDALDAGRVGATIANHATRQADMHQALMIGQVVSARSGGSLR